MIYDSKQKDNAARPEVNMYSMHTYTHTLHSPHPKLSYYFAPFLLSFVLYDE